MNAGVFVAGTHIVIAMANVAESSRSLTLRLHGAAPSLRVVEAVAVSLSRRGDPSKGEMDEATTTAPAVPLVSRDGVYTLTATLPGDSTLTVTLAP